MDIRVESSRTSCPVDRSLLATRRGECQHRDGTVSPSKGARGHCLGRRRMATIHAMTTESAPPYPSTLPVVVPLEESRDGELSRRRFLHGAALAGGGLVAAGIAACAPAAAPGWTYGPPLSTPASGSSAPSG